MCLQYGAHTFFPPVGVREVHKCPLSVTASLVMRTIIQSGPSGLALCYKTDIFVPDIFIVTSGSIFLRHQWPTIGKTHQWGLCQQHKCQFSYVIAAVCYFSRAESVPIFFITVLLCAFDLQQRAVRV